MKHTTGVLTSHDGTRLCYEHWAPAATEPWTTLVIAQGRGEHTGRYTKTATAFVHAGIAVWAVDLRGQGRSAGRRGHVRRLRDFMEDVHACVEAASTAQQHQRPVILAHSMGGLVALHYAVEYGQRLSGLILSSPLCQLVAPPVPAWQDRLASVLTWCCPIFPFTRPHDDASSLTHDPQIRTAFLTDPLVHFQVTARLYCEVRAGMLRVRELAERVYLPTLVLQGKGDKLVSPRATHRMYKAIHAEDKHYIAYEGLYHELLNELDADRVIGDILRWLQTRYATRR
jgi:alpha-beta hydrolase superfamily lysophospholipase